MALACVQDGISCLHTASWGGHLEVVKYLCEQGGKELLMLTDKVSGLWDVCAGICSDVWLCATCGFACVCTCSFIVGCMYLLTKVKVPVDMHVHIM